MSFEYTDEQLNHLNRSRNVYSVNSDFVERHQGDKNPPLLIVGKATEDLLPNETNIIKTPDKQKFQVIATRVDKSTGFDGMAVATVVKGEQL